MSEAATNVGVRLRQIAACADDFGMHDGVCSAVLELAAAGRLTAVSCLVEGPAWHRNVAGLRRVPVDIGLHLNLTERMPGSSLAMPLRTLLALSLSGALSRARVRTTIEAQLDAFEAGVGQAPDFVDGHQHVHQLPVVRDELLEALAARYKSRPWLRSTARGSQRGLAGVKGRVIESLGGRVFGHAARLLNFPLSGRLLGVYRWSERGTPYGARVARWLAQASDADLLMTHPSTLAWVGDPISAMRVREFEFLKSSAFADLLKVHHIAIARMSVLRSSGLGTAHVRAPASTS